MNVSQLYADVKKKYNSVGLTRGFEIFYGPVYQHPKFLLIGDNPGGSEEEYEIPLGPYTENTYFTETYTLARKMKTIFGAADELDAFKSSVKVNRVFFRSPGTSSPEIRDKWPELNKWCKPHIKEIIDFVQPEIIVAESIGAYNLVRKLEAARHKEDLLFHKNKSILRLATSDSKQIFGMYHPSGARHGWIDDNLLVKIGETIKSRLTTSH